MIERLAALFGLSAFERGVVELCVRAELDGTPRPTFAVALETLAESHWSALAPDAPLRRWRLVRTTAPSLLHGELSLDERILHELCGVAATEPELHGLVRAAAAPGPLAGSHAAVADRLAALLAGKGWPAALLCGGDRDLAREIAATASPRVLVVDGGALPAPAGDAYAIARLLEREAALAGATLLFELPAEGEREAAARIAPVAEGLQAPVVVSAREPVPGLEHAARFDVPAPDAHERRALWRAALGERANGSVDALAQHFALDAAGVRAAAAEANDGAGLWEACRVRSRPRLDDLAQRIESRAQWDDLVLPEPQRRTLEEIVAQTRSRSVVYDDWGFAGRGLGISALFAGESGTGKTLAAEVIASDLHLDLYRIDLSQVVSKYIGETEKNLRRVFDAAERGGVVLLFDEADALFGKRTEVRDSHDRFANIEVSYLLQRMEAYRGLAILTTNQREALDTAFLRRLRFVVEFPFPEAGEREAIWARAFPPGVPVDGVDPVDLRELAVAGGNIHNIALGAAFLAADADESVQLSHVVRAAHTEYAKLRRPLTEIELGDLA